MCWVARPRARLAELHGDTGRRQLAGGVDETAGPGSTGVDSRGVFVQHYGSKAPDASVLLIRWFLRRPRILAASDSAAAKPTNSPSTDGPANNHGDR
jgi:hypothetical protein